MSPIVAPPVPAIVAPDFSGAADDFVSGPGFGNTSVDLSAVAPFAPQYPDHSQRAAGIEARLNEMFPGSADENWIAAGHIAAAPQASIQQAGAPVSDTDFAAASLASVRSEAA